LPLKNIEFRKINEARIVAKALQEFYILLSLCFTITYGNVAMCCNSVA